jgi:beta-galactosidase
MNITNYSIANIIAFLLIALNIAYAQKMDYNGERLSFDDNWRFKMGDASSADEDMHLYGKGFQPFSKSGRMKGVNAEDYDDSSWREVDLPHDWAIELDFVNDPTIASHGYKPVGWKFPKTSVGWYRKTFEIPEDDINKRISIKFDGVFRDCDVWLNGFYLGNNLSGYMEFMYDVTDMIRYGEKNIVVVKVDATQFEGWWYEGAGIYRHTWLIKKSPVHIPEHGIYITTNHNDKNAVVNVQAEVTNMTNKTESCQLDFQIIDDEGNTVGIISEKFPVNGYNKNTISTSIRVPNPKIWSLEEPNLYKLRTTVRSENEIKDITENTFGIRNIEFDAEKGFLLNGKQVKLKGASVHQDHAGVGVALPDRMQYYRIERLKEMGCNAYRSAHHPPTPELLEACDELGMLVVPENRLLNSSPEYLSQFRRMILRDRNHPSVIIWSIGNEEMEIQNTDRGKSVAETLMHVQRELDPSRLCTFAGNNGNTYKGVNEVIDVRGVNYMALGDLDEYHKSYPNQPIFGTEEECVKSTRGQYFINKEQGYMSDFDKEENVSFGSWSSNAHEWWNYYDARDWLAGGFIWTGFDYKGETAPYKWPCVNSHNGVMDMCGFPKNNFYYYKSWWSDEDVLHIFPHWNWHGKIGEIINVWGYTNCDKVELFLNGKSQGKKTVKKNSHVEWDVVYEPGVLEARGIKNGKTIIKKIETTKAPAQIVISPDRSKISADGDDVSVLTVTVKDNQGREVPDAHNFITFLVEGDGKIIGVGNGNPSSHEPDKILTGNYFRKLFNGKCQAIVQSTSETGNISVTAISDGLRSATVNIQTSIEN